MSYGTTAYGADAYGGIGITSVAYTIAGIITIVPNCSVSMYVDVWQESLQFSSTIILARNTLEFNSGVCLHYEFSTEIPD